MNLLVQRYKNPISRAGLVLPYQEYFSTGFNDLTQSLFATMNGWSIFTGTDSETGSSWYGKSATYPNGGTGPLDTILNGVQFIVDPGVTIDNSSYLTYGNVEVLNEAGPTGANQNILSLSVTDPAITAFNGQQWLRFDSIVSTTSPLPDDLTNLYWRYYMKKPVYIDSMPEGRDIFFEVKTGGYDGLYGGDMRISGDIVKPSSGALYWQITCDRGGNGTMATTPGGATWPTSSSPSAFKYWSVANTAVPVLSNTWMKIEVYLRRATRGGMLLAVDDATVLEYFGDTMGDYDNPIGRFAPFGIYSQNGTCSGKICDLLIANYPGSGSVLEQRVIDRLF